MELTGNYDDWEVVDEEFVTDLERIEDALYFFDEMEEMDYWEDFYHYFDEDN